MKPSAHKILEATAKSLGAITRFLELVGQTDLLECLELDTDRLELPHYRVLVPTGMGIDGSQHTYALVSAVPCDGGATKVSAIHVESKRPLEKIPTLVRWDWVDFYRYTTRGGLRAMAPWTLARLVRAAIEEGEML